MKIADFLNYFSFFRRKYSVDEVFFIGGVPKYTFVQRDRIKRQLDSVVESRNRIMLFLGYSKSGKTVYRKKYFGESIYKDIVFRCNSDSTVDSLYRAIAEEAHLFNPTSERTSRSFSTSAMGNANPQKGISGGAQVMFGGSSEVTSAIRYESISLNSICNQLKNRKEVVIILEDYHLVKQEFNSRFSEDLKHLLDENILVVVIGIPGSPNRALKFNPDLAGRTERISFDYLTEEESSEIIQKGEKLLNVSFGSEVRKRVIELTMSNAFLVQSICNRLCKDKYITKTCIDQFDNFTPKNVDEACAKYVENELSTEFEPSIDMLTKESKPRGKLEKAYNQYEEILKAISKIDNHVIENGLTYTDIGKVAWAGMDPQIVKTYVSNGTYQNEATFKTSLNNQISVALEKFEEIFNKNNARPILLYNDKKLYILDIIFKFYLQWRFK